MSGVLNMLLASGPGGIVTVSGRVIADAVSDPDDAEVRLRFNSDGTVDTYTSSGGYSQIDSTTDWIIPNAFASGLYEIRATNNSASPDSGPAFGSWHTLDSNREWIWTQTAPGNKNIDVDIEIRYGSGNPLDSGNYSGSVSVV